MTRKRQSVPKPMSLPNAMRRISRLEQDLLRAKRHSETAFSVHERAIKNIRIERDSARADAAHFYGLVCLAQILIAEGRENHV